jgi:type IV pilus assembly protein PilW
VNKSVTRGYSLLELLVAMALGALVIAAAVQLLNVNQRTFRLQQTMMDVQEQGRFTLDYIVRDIYKMGFMQVDSTGNPIYTAGSISGVQQTDVMVGGVTYPAMADGGNGDDRLTFSYFSGEYGNVDCEGDVALPDVFVVNTYWVNNGDLFCMGSVDSGSTGLLLLADVDSFQVLYGIDTNKDKVPFATQYVIAPAVGANTVVAVKIGLLIRSDDPMPELGAPETFTVLNQTLVGGTDLVESKLRRLFTTTVKARNFDWREI